MIVHFLGGDVGEGIGKVLDRMFRCEKPVPLCFLGLLVTS